jgi:hypothetical protein
VREQNLVIGVVALARDNEGLCTAPFHLDAGENLNDKSTSLHNFSTAIVDNNNRNFS